MRIPQFPHGVRTNFSWKIITDGRVAMLTPVPSDGRRWGGWIVDARAAGEPKAIGRPRLPALGGHKAAVLTGRGSYNDS
jgi:hypothetical protein